MDEKVIPIHLMLICFILGMATATIYFYAVDLPALNQEYTAECNQHMLNTCEDYINSEAYAIQKGINNPIEPIEKALNTKK